MWWQCSHYLLVCLRSHIHQLRQVVDRPFASNLLHTVHGIGYRLGEPTDNG